MSAVPPLWNAPGVMPVPLPRQPSLGPHGWNKIRSCCSLPAPGTEPPSSYCPPPGLHGAPLLRTPLTPACPHPWRAPASGCAPLVSPRTRNSIPWPPTCPQHSNSTPTCRAARRRHRTLCAAVCRCAPLPPIHPPVARRLSAPSHCHSPAVKQSRGWPSRGIGHSIPRRQLLPLSPLLPHQSIGKVGRE